MNKLWLIPAAFIVTPLGAAEGGAAEGLVIEMHHIDRTASGRVSARSWRPRAPAAAWSCGRP